jgi:hypothetical protein
MEGLFLCPSRLCPLETGNFLKPRINKKKLEFLSAALRAFALSAFISNENLKLET